MDSYVYVVYHNYFDGEYTYHDDDAWFNTEEEAIAYVESKGENKRSYAIVKERT